MLWEDLCTFLTCCYMGVYKSVVYLVMKVIVLCYVGVVGGGLCRYVVSVCG